jgi:hypothetical protein
MTNLKLCPLCGNPPAERGTEWCSCANPECALAFVQTKISKWERRPLEDQKDERILELEASLRDEIGFSGIVFAASNSKE